MKNKDIIEELIVQNTCNIRTAIKKMDKAGKGFLVIAKNETENYGIVTDGDFRRAILNGVSMEKEIDSIANKNFLSLSKKYTPKDIDIAFRDKKINIIPVFENNKLVELLSRKDLANANINYTYKNLDLPVIIMAGGKGTRLDPFTRILPKPLVPIGDKPVIEVIMDEYAKYGIKDFYISVNFKSKMIKAYFEEENSLYNIDYLHEDKPLGTAGSLKYIGNSINKPFFVSNCDIIIKDDYSEIYDFHKNGKYDLTVVASMQHYQIPYGVCEIHDGGDLKYLSEKPVYDVLANTGMYLLNPEVLKFIPENTFFHITHLIEEIKKNGMKVGVYPVSEKSWLDVGQWENYKETIKILNSNS